jgi:carbamoyltransferase
MLEYRRVPPPEITTRDWAFFDHHRCHAASAYYTSPYERATVVTLDGMGDFSIGGAVYRADAGRLSLLRRSNGYFSPGHFYMIVTEYLGFTPGRHEGKITGLAALGDPSRAYGTMEKVIRYRPGKLDFIAGPVAEEFFNVIRSRPGTRTRQWYSQEQWTEAQRALSENAHVPREDCGLQFFRRLWAGYSREDIAAAAQKRFEDVIAAFVTDAVRRVGLPNLALAGGCFANVKLNQRLLELPDVEGMYIHPNMSDGGLSAGAALLLHHQRRKKRCQSYTHVPWRHVYLGPEYPRGEVTSALAERSIEHREPENLAKKIARALVDGRVVALFQGRMEYGPRALGNRSLLAAAVDNTSFNMHEEPIVCSPVDALNAFERGAADVLVMDGLWVDAAGSASEADWNEAKEGASEPGEALLHVGPREPGAVNQRR